MSTHVELARATADRDALAATLREVLEFFVVHSLPEIEATPDMVRRWHAVLDKHGSHEPVAHDSINDYCREALQREANRR